MPEAKLFHKASWSEVRPGDTVLMVWESLYSIVEIEIGECASEKSELDGRPLVVVSFDFEGSHYPRWAFGPRETVYVKSSL